MEKRRVLVCDAMDVATLGLSKDFEVDYSPNMTRDELAAKVGGYDVLVVRSRTKVNARVIANATNLKLIVRAGSGVDNIDTDAAGAGGIEVDSSPESLVESVAEYVVGVMIALARGTVSADASMKAGRWEKGRFVGVELRGKTLGIVGMGRIGTRVGEIAKVLGMKLLGYDVADVPSDTLESLGCKMVDLDSLFASSDFITLHVPLTAETRHLIDGRRLSLMKRTAFIVNTARGAVIDEAALIKSLEAKEIAGAGLDVLEAEPRITEVVTAPNTITTPHIGGQTEDAQAGAVGVAGAKIREFFG
ncbi:MAG: hydroxyacid dehydrogenase [Thaumarchaeota archaeon]|nr:hydroxyacid dehydrogenase [Nitrososphaerota archaeon]